MTTEEEKFLHLIKELMDNFNQPMSRRKLKVWHERLRQELTIQELEEAVNRALFECKFMPTGRELIEFVKGSTSAIAHDKWEEAKHTASRGIKKVENSNLSPATKHAILGIGGLTKIGLMTEKEEPWVKKEFINLYESYSKIPHQLLTEARNEPTFKIPSLETVTRSMP